MRAAAVEPGLARAKIYGSLVGVVACWRWALIPVLAVVAYASVLRIGFLADDVGLLQTAQAHTNPFDALVPIPRWYFYRPVGTFLTWEIGWDMWGLNPVPYHLLGLFLHAAVSLVLALWAAELSGKKWLGWLAGALFAVYPLHLEAVGWLSAQWDEWAALFGLLSVLFFTRW
ncbi:MAG TPA: hypothetical protein VM409_04325, partial [Chloroflexia bacterium]|nr:hypothetical protein [Chloroflexia bacterium]